MLLSFTLITAEEVFSNLSGLRTSPNACLRFRMNFLFFLISGERGFVDRGGVLVLVLLLSFDD